MMSDLSLEDPNNTAEGQTGLHATTPDQGDFSGGCILQVAPNLSGNRTPHHFVDGIQGIGSTFGGRGVVGQAIQDFPGVSGDAQRIGVLGNGNDSGVLGLVGFRNGTAGIPGAPITVVIPGDPPGTPSDVGIPASAKILHLPQVGISSAGVVGIAQDSQAAVHPHAGVLGINLGSGDGVLGHSGNGNGVVGISADVNQFGRGGVFSSTVNAQVRLVPLHPKGSDPHAALPNTGVAGDLIAITVKVAGIPPPGEVTSLWFCTQTGNPTNAVWKQIA
jgi:hypothetical protein